MFFAGLAKGINTELVRSRQEEADLAEREAGRENSVLTHLASADDPEIASMAVAGLMDQAAGRRPAKGLRGWLGAMAGNPALPRIRDLMAAGKQQTTTTGGPTQMPESASAAMPPGSMVDGAPGISLSAAHNALPQDPGQTTTTTVPRQPFLTPVEKARQLEGAQISGKLDAYRSASGSARTPEERELVNAAAGIRRPSTGQFMGNQQLPDGSWVRQERFFNADSGQYELSQVPIAAPVALQAKPSVQVLAAPDGQPHAYRVMPDGTKTDLGAKPVKDGYVTYTDPDTQQVVSVPAPAVFQRPTATPPPGAVAAPLSAPPPAAVAPSPAVAGGQPGGVATPPPGAPVAGAKPGAKPKLPAGVNRGAGKATQVEGAILGPDGMPQAATALFRGGTEYLDPATGQAFQGFIPGDMGKAAVAAFAGSQATVDKIDQAIQAIEKSGFAQSTDPKDTLTLWRMYRGGANPAADAFGSLTSLASLAGTSQYVKSNSRSMAMFNRAAEHTAKLPSDTEAVWGTTPGLGRVITPENAMRVGGSPWDSPAALIAKLQTSKQATLQAMQELRNASGKVPSRVAGGPPSGAAATSSQGPGAAPQMIRARDPQGNLHEAPAGTPLPAGWTAEPGQ